MHNEINKFNSNMGQRIIVPRIDKIHFPIESVVLNEEWSEYITTGKSTTGIKNAFSYGEERADTDNNGR